MRPTYLSLRGVNSFIEKQEIFFDSLCQQGLFCIAGATGSGKTTILDSIILALYSRGGRGRLSDYVNLSSPSAEIVFEFISEGSLYRIERQFFKDGSKPSKCMFTCVSDGRVLADQVGKAEIEIRRIVGLKREEFTQIAIIEQGRFAEFLSSDKATRNSIVGNLFRLDRYRNLYGRFSERVRELNSVMAVLKDQCSQYGEVSEEGINELVRTLNELRNRLSEVGLAYEDSCQRLQQNLNLKLQWDNMMAARERLQAAEGKLNELTGVIESLNKKIQDVMAYQEEANHKIASIERARELLGELEGLKHVYNQQKAQLERLSALELEQSKGLDQARIISNKQQICENELRKLAKQILDDLTLIESIFIMDSQHIRAFYCSQQNAREGQARGQSVNLGNSNGAEVGLSSGDIRLFLHEQGQRARAFIDQRGAVQSQIEYLKKELEVLRVNQAGQQERAEQKGEQLRAIEEQTKAILHQIAQTRLHLKQAQISDCAWVVRSGLQEGDACPVCGGEIKAGEVAKGSDQSAVLESRLLQYEQELETLRVASNEVFTELSAARLQAEGGSEAIAERTTSLLKMENELEQISRQAIRIDRIEELPALFEGLIVGAQRFEALCEQSQGLLVHRESIDNDLGRLSADIMGTRKELESSQAIIYKKTQGEDLFSMQNRVASEIASDTDYVNRFQRVLADSRQILNDSIKEEAELNGQIKTLKLTAEQSIDFDQSVFEQLQISKEQLEAQRQNVAREITALECGIATARDNLCKKNKLQEQIDSISSICDRLMLILKIIKGDRFLEYVAEEYIHRFTAVASDILARISSGKYTLEYIDGTFYVRDFLRGNELRRSATLSGGETFLASLSLAIAISGEISSYKSFEFFFLDEGFGTLDTASLDIVYEALETLSRDTLVGIVTHRSELVDKIQSRITVISATDSCGSRVIMG